MKFLRDHLSSLLIAIVLSGTLAINLYMARTALETAPPSSESVIRMSVASQLFGGDSRDYHALIDSVVMPPLPSLGGLLFLSVDDIWGRGSGFLVLLSLMSALGVVLFGLLGRHWGLGFPLGSLVGAALLLNPWLPFAAWRGASVTGSVMFIAAIAWCFALWLRTDRLRALAMGSILLALACLWDARFLMAAFPAAAAVLGKTGRRSGEWAPSQRQGLFLVFLTPVLYFPAIWLLFNWLIFGKIDWLFHHVPEVFFARYIVAACAGAIFALPAFLISRFASRSDWGLVPVAALMLVGLWLESQQNPSAQELALLGQPLQSKTELREVDHLQRYLQETKGGRYLLVIGRPGYQLREALDFQAGIVHRLELSDIDGILEDTKGRDLSAVLSDSQVRVWKQKLGEEKWEQRFIEDMEYRRHMARLMGEGGEASPETLESRGMGKTNAISSGSIDSTENPAPDTMPKIAWRVFYCVRPLRVN
jgi:hypothetical protein